MPNLTEKYRPQRIEDFVGLENPKKILLKFAQNPYSSNWLFFGSSGTGKTSMALALASKIDAQVLHIPSQKCTVDEVEDTTNRCWTTPNRLISGMTRSPDRHLMDEGEIYCKFWFVLVDEADRITPQAKVALLSKLDGTATPPNTIFVFTCNDIESVGDDYGRFLSRLINLKFSTYGLLDAAIPWLESIWKAEANGASMPNLEQWMKECKNNLRDALKRMEVELLQVGP